MREVHTPYRLQTDLLALALAAEHAAAGDSEFPPPPDDAVDNPDTEKPCTSGKGMPYVLIPRAPYDTSSMSCRRKAVVRTLRVPGGEQPIVTHNPRVNPAGYRTKSGSKKTSGKKSLNKVAYDKERSWRRRFRNAREQDANDLAEYGALRRHDKPSAFTVLGRAEPTDIDVNLAFDHTNKALRTFPVASTGWIGARVAHTDEERIPQPVDWYIKRGFKYMPCQGR